jgi:hypothetical protein
LGYDLGGQVAPGGNLHLTLFWEALSTPREDYTVLVHLVDEQGQIRAQGDSQPVAGYHPTSRWTEGEIVRDQYHLALPETVTTGEYTLLVGMYQPGTGVRLPVLGKGTTIMGDRITLGTFEVTGP